MIDENELLFVVDGQNKPLKPLPRHFVHKNILWHRATGIWVVNSVKQILCQKRSLKVDIKPGKWSAFFGGHLHPKDTYKSNAIEELSEELGIYVQEKKLIPYNILKSDKPTHKEFQHAFIYKLINKKITFRFEKEEIDEVRWLDLEEVKKHLLSSDPKWEHKPWDGEILKFIEQMKI
jgi:isopentenyldiphosphate isomerase